MGITGMLIGVPLAATAYRLLQKSVNAKPVLSGGECGGISHAEEAPVPENDS